MQFGMGLFSNVTPGVMGLGYASLEAVPNGTAYLNLVDQMVSQGIIASRTYSLYLNDLDAASGTILFGGVDTQKFSGTLHTIPINPDLGGGISAFYITLTGIGLTPPWNSSTAIGPPSVSPLNVLLDSGSTFIALPAILANAIAAGLGASLDDLGFYDLPNCDSQFSNDFVDFEFSGIKISVPYSEFIVKDAAGCFLGLQTLNSTGCGTLGDTFLRSAYVVYDLVLH